MGQLGAMKAKRPTTAGSSSDVTVGNNLFTAAPDVKNLAGEEPVAEWSVVRFGMKCAWLDALLLSDVDETEIGVVSRSNEAFAVHVEDLSGTEGGHCSNVSKAETAFLDGEK